MGTLGGGEGNAVYIFARARARPRIRSLQYYLDDFRRSVFLATPTYYYLVHPKGSIL